MFVGVLECHLSKFIIVNLENIWCGRGPSDVQQFILFHHSCRQNNTQKPPHIYTVYTICSFDTTWRRVWFHNSTCLLYLKCVYSSQKALEENVLRHHGNQSSGCRDSRLHKAAAQSERNKRKGRSFDKIVPVLRETQGDGKICSYWCWDVMTIPLLRRK